MKELRTPQDQPNVKQNASPKEENIKAPLGYMMEIRDMINPITIKRMHLLQFGALALLLAIGASYYWYYYVKEPTGLALVDDWVAAAGGEDAWNDIDHGQFQRVHKIFAESGELLDEKIETFFFEKMDGGLKFLINTKTPEGVDLWVGQDEQGYWATRNGFEEDPGDAARKAGMMCDSEWCNPDCAASMAFYRFSMPFKLQDDGVIPQTAGSIPLNGKEAHVLDVSYRPFVGRDRWVFYAHPDENLIRKIEYHHKSDHGSNYPEEMYWSNHQEVAGLTIAHTWTRYWSNGKVLEEYTFSGFDFDSKLPSAFYNRPGV